MRLGFLKIAVSLGLLQAIGPFAIDMYLPALPQIGAHLHVGVATLQASLMAYMLALGLGQLFYGPWSDMAGRKRPLYAGLTLFAAGGIGCALAPNAEWLIICRFLQGLGACACTVVPRAVVRDMYTGVEAAKLMSSLMLVLSVSPILAPLGGSLMLGWGGWRGIFWVLAGVAILGMLLVAGLLRETRPPSARLNSSVGAAWQGYRALLRDRHYLGLILVGAFGVASFFIYVANSSFVMIGHYGLSTRHYSLLFSLNAVGFIGAAQFSAALGRRFGLPRLVITAVSGFAVVMFGLSALYLLGVDRLPLLMGLLFIGFSALGLVVPNTAVLALDRHGAIAGTASALLGTCQFMMGALLVAIVARFADGTALPMVLGITVCAVLAWLLALFSLRRNHRLIEDLALD